MKKIQLSLLAVCLGVGYANAQCTTPSNAITTAHYLGSSTNIPVVFKMNATKAGQIDATNTSLGLNTLLSTTPGSYNTAMGVNTLSNNVGGTNNAGWYNSAFGWQTLYMNTSGNYNTGFGVQALKMNTIGGSNTAVGLNTLFWNTTGIANTAVGGFSGYTNDASATGGNYNTFLGSYSDITPGAGNLTNATAIGFDAMVGQSNSMVLGGTGTYAVKVGIGTTTPQARLEVNSNTTGVSGLRLSMLTSTSAPTPANSLALSVNSTGDVILVPSSNAWWTNSTIGTGNVINNNTGGVIIGTGITSTPAGYSLYVSQGVLTEKLKIALKTSTNWADYVFDKNYKLQSLDSVENYINVNKHLPNVPSADELVKDGGVDVQDMLSKQMAKIEELTLYMIEMKKEVELLKKQNAELQEELDKK